MGILTGVISTLTIAGGIGSMFSCAKKNNKREERVLKIASGLDFIEKTLSEGKFDFDIGDSEGLFSSGVFTATSLIYAIFEGMTYSDYLEFATLPDDEKLRILRDKHNLISDDYLCSATKGVKSVDTPKFALCLYNMLYDVGFNFADIADDTTMDTEGRIQSWSMLDADASLGTLFSEACFGVTLMKFLIDSDVIIPDDRLRELCLHMLDFISFTVNDASPVLLCDNFTSSFGRLCRHFALTLLIFCPSYIALVTDDAFYRYLCDQNISGMVFACMFLLCIFGFSICLWYRDKVSDSVITTSTSCIKDKIIELRRL